MRVCVPRGVGEVVNSLAELYAGHAGRVSQKWAGYLVAYDDVLAPRRPDRLTLLEVGVQNGGSLEVWSRYFPSAQVLVGCDIEPACAELTFDDPRIHVLVGDAGDPATIAAIASIAPSFDIIIDDGSHRSDDIVRTFVRLLPMLADGGVYIIEDLHCSYLESFAGGLFAQRSALSFFRRLVDVINIAHWGLDLDARGLLGPIVPEALGDEFIRALPTLRSVEFLDSLCIVRVDSAARTRLGTRVVAGAIADVDGSPLAEAGRPSPLPLERAEAVDHDPVRHEDTIRALEADLARLMDRLAAIDDERRILRAQLDRILSSRSWRLTSGLRGAFRLLFRRR